MPPFQDEAEEPDASQVHVKKRPRVSDPERSGACAASLFGEEPEETLRQRPSSSSRGSKKPRLFGEEPEEVFGKGGQNSSSKGSREPSVHVQDDSGSHSSSDNEDESRPAALNIGWSALNMFSKAKFMNKVSKAGEPQTKKRPYNNSNRAQRASETKKTARRSYKTTALDPSRLTFLKKSTACKCDSVECRTIMFLLWERVFLSCGRLLWFSFCVCMCSKWCARTLQVLCFAVLLQNCWDTGLPKIFGRVLGYGQVWARLLCALVAFSEKTVANLA